MTRINTIEFCELRIPFNVRFSHAAFSRKTTQSLLVRITTSNGLTGYGEGCPREYVTGESISSAKKFVNINKKYVIDNVFDLNSLKAVVNKLENQIDKNPAAWCALELAVLDVLAQNEKSSVESLLNIPDSRKKFHYTAVLGNGDFSKFQKQVYQYKESGLDDFKVKLSGKVDDDKAKLGFLVDELAYPRIRVDANNLWKNKNVVIPYMHSLKIPIFAIEEPLAKEQFEDLANISQELGMQIILDESFQRCAQLTYVQNKPDTWILNVRVSKMGGLIRSLDIINEAKRLGVKIIVGAHVGESSLLTRAGIVIAQAANHALLAQEGGFGTYLLKYDVCDNPLQFKKGGCLCIDDYDLQATGFGLNINYENVISLQ